MIANCHFLALAKSNRCFVKLGNKSLLICAKTLNMFFFKDIKKDGLVGDRLFCVNENYI